MYHTSNNYSSLSNDFSLLIHQTGEVLLVIAFMKWFLSTNIYRKVITENWWSSSNTHSQLSSRFWILSKKSEFIEKSRNIDNRIIENSVYRLHRDSLVVLGLGTELKLRRDRYEWNKQIYSKGYGKAISEYLRDNT